VNLRLLEPVIVIKSVGMPHYMNWQVVLELPELDCGASVLKSSNVGLCQN